MHPIKPILFAILLAVPAMFLPGASESPTKPNQQLIERGRYLVAAGGCNDCHTPHKCGPKGLELDTTRLLSGHPADAKLPPPPAMPPGPWSVVTTGDTAWAGPWGISYSANLTPDVNTGLGIWTEDVFLRAMRTGKHYGASRDILPPMPWQALAQMTDDDLRAMFAYLRSIPAVVNRVPEPQAPAGLAHDE